MSDYKPVIEQGQIFAPHFTVNSASQGASSWFDLYLGGVRGVFSGAFKIWIGRWVSTAFSTGYPKIRLQGRLSASGEIQDILPAYIPSVGASVAATTASAGASAGASSFTVASGTNIATGDKLFAAGNGGNTPQVIEVRSVSGASPATITPVNPLEYAISSGDTITDQAEVWEFQANLAPYKEIRLLADNQGNSSSQAVTVRGVASLVKSISD